MKRCDGQAEEHAQCGRLHQRSHGKAGRGRWPPAKQFVRATARPRTTGQRSRGRLRIGSADVQLLSRNPPAAKIQRHNKKAPRDTQGLFGSAPSREERGPLRHGRVAWLTAFQPITVAGPRPIHTAFPASLACNLKLQCKPRLRQCQCARTKRSCRFSGSSNSVCAFPPARADLPGNPRGDRVRLRKYSSNA